MAYKTSKIALSSTEQFSKLFIDFINGEENLRKFYAYPPQIDSFKQAIENKSKEKIDRALLVDVLKKQYTDSNIENATKLIESLLDKNTYTVCTGHQLCLFTGPLYFIYKIITTINLAESLKNKYPENNFVPVYWMASEDHDFEEVKSINLFGKKISWDNPEARGAVGRLKTDSLSSVLDELKQVLGTSANADELIQLFSDAYTKQADLKKATRYLVNKLFGDFGLVILDGDDAGLKAAFSKIIKDDILNNTNYKMVTQTIHELAEIGVKPQVNPREINCFYMVDGVRERLIVESSKFKVQSLGITFTKEELLAELQNHPERFSPNVVTRPIYQQQVLPNLAYVGGPGEIAYWLEYKAMFDNHKIQFPILMPRNFAMLIDDRSLQQMKKLGLTVSDIFKDPEVLIKEFVNRNASSDLSLKAEEKEIIDIFSAISTKALTMDATLKSSVEAELQKTLNGLKNIENKILRSEKQKQETSLNQIRNLKEKYIPEGMLQERFDNLSPYYLRSGKQFISNLKEQFDPFDFEMLIMEI